MTEKIINWPDIDINLRPTDKKTEYRILGQILTATEEQIDSLILVAKNPESITSFRRGAITRLMEIKPDRERTEFLRILFEDSEQDDDVRVTAYRNFRYLKVEIGDPMSEEERTKLIPTETSPRLRWLMSLRD